MSEAVGRACQIFYASSGTYLFVPIATTDDLSGMWCHVRRRKPSHESRQAHRNHHQPVLKQFGGACLVSDAMWVIH
jgi:hypothetical protein